MPFTIIRNDITKVHADAIVNTANPEPCYGSGTDAAIYRAAGEQVLLAERRKIGRIAPGEVAATPAFALPAKYILHTVGPAWIDGQHGELAILRSCYRQSLELAERLGCESVAFPLIATGVYGFPKDQALETALAVIREYLDHSELSVTLVVFGRGSYQTARGLTEQIEEYIDENYVAAKLTEEYGAAAGSMPAANWREERLSAANLPVPSMREERIPVEPLQAPSFRGESRRDEKPSAGSSLAERLRARREHARELRSEATAAKAKGPFEGGAEEPCFAVMESSIAWEPAQEDVSVGKPAPKEAFQEKPAAAGAPLPKATHKKPSLEEAVSKLGETFQQRLLRMIDERGMTDPEVYKRANVDRKVFSKIRCSDEYTPKKRTIVALAIALRLNLDDTRDLLASAGLALTNNSKSDLIVAFCIENEIYDIFKVNSLLFQFDQPILG